MRREIFLLVRLLGKFDVDTTAAALIARCIDSGGYSARSLFEAIAHPASRLLRRMHCGPSILARLPASYS
jgi:hypothetical protein